MIKIVVLDGNTLNPGDLNCSAFGDYGQVTWYDITMPEDIATRIGDAQVVITNKTPLRRKDLEKCKNVRYIGLLSTGYNIIDLEYTNENGIIVSNVPDYSTNAVAQHTFALILQFYNMVSEHCDKVFDGQWAKSPNFCLYSTDLHELMDKTIGIIGFGSIGKKVAKLAQVFDMKVLVNTRTVDKSYESENLRFVSKEELFAKSDIVTVHCPLFPETRNLVNADMLSLMKKNAIVVNTSRGGIVDEVALCDALNSGKIAGAAVDVVSVEPIREDNPLLKAKNCVITPHIAWAARETRERLFDIVIENLKGFLDGKPQNVVR